MAEHKKMISGFLGGVESCSARRMKLESLVKPSVRTQPSYEPGKPIEDVARELGLPLYFSWREGGLEREMLRDNQPTGPIWTEMPDGTFSS